MIQPPGQAEFDLPGRLSAHAGQLLGFVRREAGAALLRFDAPEDLVQGVHQEALRAAAQFEWRGEEAFLGWLYQIARRHMSGRRDYWFALKRNCVGALRLTWTGSDGSVRQANLADTATGPATFAQRREQLVLMTRAIALLLPRDREIVRWTSDGVSLEDQALRLGVTADAAARARSRAIERLRKTFELVSRKAARA